MHAIHFICRRNDGISLNNLSYDKESKLFRSGYWDISKAEAETLVGGWVYLHPTKSAGSEFGGVVTGFERVVVPELLRPERVVLLVEKRPEGFGQRWRGKDYGMAHTGQCVAADLPHEAAR
jgi:hypothetical protein